MSAEQSGAYVTLPRERVERAAFALHARACLDALGVPLPGGCADYCLAPDLAETRKSDSATPDTTS